MKKHEARLIIRKAMTGSQFIQENVILQATAVAFYEPPKETIESD